MDAHPSAGRPSSPEEVDDWGGYWPTPLCGLFGTWPLNKTPHVRHSVGWLRPPWRDPLQPQGCRR